MTFNFLGPGLTVNVEAKVKEQIILDSSEKFPPHPTVFLLVSLPKIVESHQFLVRTVRFVLKPTTSSDHQTPMTGKLSGTVPERRSLLLIGGANRALEIMILKVEPFPSSDSIWS